MSRDDDREKKHPPTEKEEETSSLLYCETEHNAFDNKMHPAKIAGKNWVDCYKLA